MSRLAYPLVFVGLQACLAARPAPRISETVTAKAPPATEDLRIAPADTESDIAPEPAPEQLPPAAEQPPHPFAELSDEQLEEILLADPDSLGPISVGRPNAGALVGGKVMPDGEQWEVVKPRETWGTHETIEYLKRCIGSVNEQFPDTPPIPIGDISDSDGGHLAPHLSHQSGRDVDIGYYYTTDDKWYTKVNANNLDFPRSWAFVKAMITETDVEVIFIDRSVQKLLREYAVSIGEDEGWLDEIFGGPSTTLRALIRHEKGHRSHIHVRFYNPTAQESGRRVYRMLLKHKLIKPPTYYVKYRVRRGDTLMRIARRYKTTVKAIKKANRLRSSRIYAGRTYRIPRRGGVRPLAGPLVLPERRLPPQPPGSVPANDEAQAAEAVTSGGEIREESERASLAD